MAWPRVFGRVRAAQNHYLAQCRVAEQAAAAAVVEQPKQTFAELRAMRWRAWREDTRDFTARQLGDPPPGRSALDAMQRG
jgi:hypothetical protein